MGALLSPQQQGESPGKVGNGDEFDHGLSFVGGFQAHMVALTAVFPHLVIRPSSSSALRQR